MVRTSPWLPDGAAATGCLQVGVGYQWQDSPVVGAGLLVVTDNDPALADRCDCLCHKRQRHFPPPRQQLSSLHAMGLSAGVQYDIVTPGVGGGQVCGRGGRGALGQAGGLGPYAHRAPGDCNHLC